MTIDEMDEQTDSSGDRWEPSETVQGTLVPCVDCTVLELDVDPCPVCDGKREHFQPAQMADDEVQHGIGRDDRLYIERARSGNTGVDITSVIRTVLRHSFIYGPTWLAGYHGADIDTTFSESEFLNLRDGLKEEFFRVSG